MLVHLHVSLVSTKKVHTFNKVCKENVNIVEMQIKCFPSLHRAPGKGSTVCLVLSKVTYTWPSLQVPAVSTKTLPPLSKMKMYVLVEHSITSYIAQGSRQRLDCLVGREF